MQIPSENRRSKPPLKLIKFLTEIGQDGLKKVLIVW